MADEANAVTGLTAKIYEQSDNALAEEVAAAFRGVESLCHIKYPHIDVGGKLFFGPTLVELLKRGIEDSLRDDRRKQAISAFVARVDSLSEQVESLKSGVPYDE